jgi:restriction system protein
MRRYYRIMLGAKSAHASTGFEGGFVGADWFSDVDLIGQLDENWRDFNRKFIPKFLSEHPGKSKVSAGLACGMLHTICKGAKIDDVVVCPDGKGSYKVGAITSDYFYVRGQPLPHRRKVAWYPTTIDRAAMSEKLQNSTGSIGTVSDITKYADEIENLAHGGQSKVVIQVSDETIEDPSSFALEKHLEDFLVTNWQGTELAQRYEIFSEDGELIGQQYPTETGPIDILAISKDRKELLVIELKKGRASDAVLGQIQRYMGYILSEVAEANQTVRGCIIALEDDVRIRYALKVNPSIDFYRYQVSFKLVKA